MSGRGLIPGRRNRLEKTIHYPGIGRTSAERKVNEVDASCLSGSSFALNVGALFGGKAQVEYRLESHFLDFRDSRWRDSARARDGALEASKSWLFRGPLLS